MCTVLAGKTVPQMRQFFLSNGTRGSYLRDNQAAMELWIGHLKGLTPDSDDHQVLDLVPDMCTFAQEDRPSATEVVSLILDFEGQMYYDFCCDREQDHHESADADLTTMFYPKSRINSAESSEAAIHAEPRLDAIVSDISKGRPKTPSLVQATISLTTDLKGYPGDSNTSAITVGDQNVVVHKELVSFEPGRDLTTSSSPKAASGVSETVPLAVNDIINLAAGEGDKRDGPPRLSQASIPGASSTVPSPMDPSGHHIPYDADDNEVDGLEKNHQGMLKASTVAMAKKFHATQQSRIDEAEDNDAPTSTLANPRQLDMPQHHDDDPGSTSYTYQRYELPTPSKSTSETARHFVGRRHPNDSGAPSPTRNNLLDPGNGAPYRTSQRPPANDTQLLQQHDNNNLDEAQARPSISYSEYIGGERPQDPRKGKSSGDQARRPFAAPYKGTDTRTYSQTSDLHNHSRYVDEAGDDYSASGNYYGAGASAEHIPGGKFDVGEQAHGRDKSNVGSGRPQTPVRQPDPDSTTSRAYSDFGQGVTTPQRVDVESRSNTLPARQSVLGSSIRKLPEEQTAKEERWSNSSNATTEQRLPSSAQRNMSPREATARAQWEAYKKGLPAELTNSELSFSNTGLDSGPLPPATSLRKSRHFYQAMPIDGSSALEYSQWVADGSPMFPTKNPSVHAISSGPSKKTSKLSRFKDKLWPSFAE